MLFDENARLSARVFGTVLNYPLYDADCCPAARELLAVGDVAGAIGEWRRLADLGSGNARCVLAYLNLMGAPSMPVDLEEARRAALSAVSGARGYANYLLGCIAMREKQPAEAGKYFVESIKAGFMPAATHLASLSIRGASQEGKRAAVGMLRKSAAAGHCPARLRLAGVHLSGQLGLSKRLVGLILLVPAFVRCWIAIKYQAFSIHCFQVAAIPSEQGLFNEVAVEGLQKAGSAASRVSRRAIIRWTHAIAVVLPTTMVVRSQSFSRQDRHASALETVSWALLAAWPYGLSYLIASTVNTRRLISTLVQTMMMWLVTMLACSAYSGQMFASSRSVWDIVQITVVQAFLLLVACGLGERAAQQVETTDLPITPGRYRMIWVHGILGLLAAGSWLSRPSVWHLDLWREQGFNLASCVLLATLPYAASAVLGWRLVTANRWRPWAYVGVLILGTALAVANNTGIWMMQPGVLGVALVLMVQFIVFVLAAEWALDGTEW